MTRPTRGWYQLDRPTNETGDRRAVVRIYDAIGGWFGADPQMFADELDQLDVTEIELRVNSPGGDVFDGLAIMNTLRAHPARVVAHIDGLAASAASFIVVGGADEVVMGLGSELMLHNPRAITIGPSNLHRDTADRLDKIADSLIAVYQNKAGGDLEAWRAVLAAETWYSGQEAVDAGLADRLDPDSAAPEPVSNRLGIRFSAYAGRQQAPAPVMPGRQNPAARAGHPTQERSRAVAFSDEQLSTMRERLGIAADADEATIVAALNEALDEQADPAPTPAPTPPAGPPPGVVQVSQDVFDQMRADATAGREAANRQAREDRERVVDAAVADGRIPPARREHWIGAIAADAGMGEVLAGLQAGLVPVDQPRGHAQEATNDDPAQTDDYWFPGVTSAAASREG